MAKKVNIRRVFKNRNKLFQALSPYTEFTITAETLQDVVTDLCKALPNNVSRDAVFESCRFLAGLALTRKLAAEFAWRLAGNLELLLRGTPVIPWTRQITDEWLPVQVTHVDPAFRRGTPGQLFRLRAISGHFCPGVFEQFVSRGSCVAIARTIGFSRALPYSNPSYFVNLRFVGYVEAAKSVENPQFGPVACPPAMKAYNKRIISIRVRKAPCPRNFEHLCDTCPINADSCSAALFLQGLTARYCSTCNQIKPFDITRSEELCFACWTEKRIKRTAGA